MITGTSGVSGLTGGNCSVEEHRAYQRMEEEMMSEQMMIGPEGECAEYVPPGRQPYGETRPDHIWREMSDKNNEARDWPTDWAHTPLPEGESLNPYVNEREALAEQLESLACDLAGAVLMLHWHDPRAAEAELRASIARTMLLRSGLLTETPAR